MLPTWFWNVRCLTWTTGWNPCSVVYYTRWRRWMTGGLIRWPISWEVRWLITRMEMPLLRMPWCSWDRRTCWWIARETGEISWREMMRLPDVISRRVFRSLPWRWLLTRRRRTGSCHTTVGRESRWRYPWSSRYCWLKGWKVLQWGWPRRYCRIISTSCWMPVSLIWKMKILFYIRISRQEEWSTCRNIMTGYAGEWWKFGPR